MSITFGAVDFPVTCVATWLDDVGHLPGSPATGQEASIRARLWIDGAFVAISGDVNTQPNEFSPGQDTGQYRFILNQSGNFPNETSPASHIIFVPFSTNTNIRVVPVDALGVSPPNFQDLNITDSAHSAGAGRIGVYWMWGERGALLGSRSMRAQGAWTVETYTVGAPLDTIDCVVDPETDPTIFSPSIANFYDIGGVKKRIQFHSRPGDQRNQELALQINTYTPHATDNKRGSFTFDTISASGIVIATNDKFNVA